MHSRQREQHEQRHYGEKDTTGPGTDTKEWGEADVPDQSYVFKSLYRLECGNPVERGQSTVSLLLPSWEGRLLPYPRKGDGTGQCSGGGGTVETCEGQVNLMEWTGLVAGGRKASSILSRFVLPGMCLQFSLLSYCTAYPVLL